MKKLYIGAIVIGLGFLGVAASIALLRASPVAPDTFPADVTQHHKHNSRDGLYLDPLFTTAAASNLTRDVNFDGTIVGNVYAQPLYVDVTSSPNGAMVIAVTESNNVYALNATTGSIIWQRNVGAPITSGLPCGNINPVGITATPVIDLGSHALFLDAEVNGIGHQIFSLNFDTGAINPGWPVTLNTAVPGFTSSVQSSRAALGLIGGILYVPYGGRFGDCGSYHGRLVGVPINDPATVMDWATVITKAGVWGPGGVASDGTNTFVVTGNGSSAGTWSGSEAVIRLQPGPSFSGSPTDYWAPPNWQSLDSGDTDLGGSGAILVDVAGANPGGLVVALGKDGNAYLLNRSNLGGVSSPVAQASVGGTIIQAAASYTTSTGTYVVLRPGTGTLTAFRITATTPPTIATGWSVSSSGRTSPFVTTDGSNAIVWVAGSDQRLRGYNGDTGAVIFGGGGATDVMSGVRSYNTGIAARGRIYYATDNKVYAFNLPTTPPTPTATATSTPSSPTPTATATVPPSPTATATATATAPARVTPTATFTSTPTATVTATSTATASATATASGTATVSATATATATASATATATAGTPSPSPAEPVNLSTRMRVLTQNHVGIAGFILTGTNSRRGAPTQKTAPDGGNFNLLRAIGPSLSSQGVPDPLADPVMELHGPFPTITNDNWRDGPNAQEIQALGLAPTNDLESAILAPLDAGAYTAIVKGTNDGVGVGLVEIYHLSAGINPKLGNISTRAFVDTADNIVIAGFILGGNTGNDHIVVRGIGPSLVASGVPDALTDPMLELRNNNGAILMTNNDWQDNSAQAKALMAAGLAPTDPHESGISISIPPGIYTALLSGVNNGTGVGLVEVYDLGSP